MAYISFLIFRANFALVYITKTCRTTFTSKTRKIEQDLATVLYVILKTLEKLFNGHIRDMAQITSLRSNAYNAGMSTSCWITEKAEYAYKKKELFLATFLDTEGTFNKTNCR